MRYVRKILPAYVTLCLMLMLGFATPASATSERNSWNIPGGNVLEVFGSHCNTFVRTCDWGSHTKMFGTRPYNAQWIENRTTLEAHGFRASITISAPPSAEITIHSRSMGTVRWRNFNAWTVYNSGTLRPSWSTAYVSVESCGSAKVTNRIFVSEKCVRAGAF